MQFDVKSIFPYKEIRNAQSEALDFALDAFINQGKKFVIIEAGTGVGKSAVGVTLSRYMDTQPTHTPAGEEEPYKPGGYFLTTQKILQEQYVKDFAKPAGKMCSIKSSSNYTCSFSGRTNCGEGQRLLKVAEKGTPQWRHCVFNCTYKNAKDEFLASPESVTNFSYFLAETTYAGKLKPRNMLVIDEAHNVETELSKFIEVAVTERFAKTLKLQMPHITTQLQAIDWVKDVYAPKLRAHVKHIEKMLDKYTDLREKLQEFSKLAKQYDLLDKHACKIQRFLDVYDKDNWVFNMSPAEGRRGRRLEFKPIDVAPFADDMVFKHGKHVVMMSATILDRDAFCTLLGIPREKVAFISIPSPFPVEHRPIMTFSIGKMSAKAIDDTLPKLAEAVKAIMEQHKNEKGIIHCHTYKIANYLKRNIRSKRLLIHDSDNRETILDKHIKSKTPTVLLSPSMTEGIDLYDELGRFQIICKVPYPYLGDKLVKKRMHKWRWWYPLQTAKSIVQAVGRSVRSMDDHAVTYILDSDWDFFYGKNKVFFPQGFSDCLK